MHLVIRNDNTGADVPVGKSEQTPLQGMDRKGNGDDDKLRATERLQKLRNLSFNLNASDSSNELENVPAYIRRNMELPPGNFFGRKFLQ
jgi:cell division protein FtsZ